MKRLKVVAWDILNKASIQVGALMGWVFMNACTIPFLITLKAARFIHASLCEFVIIQFCNFVFQCRIKKIGVGPPKNRSTRMIRRRKGPSSLIYTKPSNSRQRSDVPWRITYQFPWPLSVSRLHTIFFQFSYVILFFCSLVTSLQRRESEFET